MAQPIDIQTLLVNFEANTRRAERAFIRYASKAEQAAFRAEKEFRRSNRQIAQSTQRMAADIRRVIAGIAVAYASREVITLADSWTEAANKIAAAEQISGLQLATLQQLGDAAVDARSEFSTYVDLYARIARAGREVQASQQEVAKATNLVAKAFQAGGASAQEQASGIIQLGQALGSGFLQGEELRAIRENAPLIAQAIADEFDTTIGGLKELGAEGELVSRRVLDAILNAGENIQAAYDVTIPTIAQSFGILNTRIGQFIFEQNQATGASAALSDAILFVADNVETFAAALVVAGAALGGAALGGALARIVPVILSIGPAAAGSARALVTLRAALAALGGPVVIGFSLAAAAIALIALRSKEAAVASEEFKAQSTQLSSALNTYIEAQIAANEASSEAKANAEALAAAARAEAEAVLEAAEAKLADARATIAQAKAQQDFALQRQRFQTSDALQLRPFIDFGDAQRDIEQTEANINALVAQVEEARQVLSLDPSEVQRPTVQSSATIADQDDGPTDALRAAQQAVQELESAYIRLGQTEEDAIEAAYAARLAAIRATTENETERARLTAQADTLRFDALAELSAKEAEAAARRKEAALDQVRSEEEAVREILDARDQLAGRTLSILAREQEARRADAEAQIGDKRRLSEALALIDEEFDLRRQEIRDRVLGVGEGDGPDAEIERVRAVEAEKLAALQDARAQQLVTEAEFQQRRLELSLATETEIQRARDASIASAVSAAASGFSALTSASRRALGENSGIYKTLAAASRAFAIFEAGLKISTAVAQVLADPTKVTLEQKLAAAGAIAAGAATILNAVSQPVPGFADGGYTGPGGRNQFAGHVHKGEVVMSQDDVSRLGLRNLLDLRTGDAIISRPGGPTKLDLKINNMAPGVEVKPSRGPGGALTLDIVESALAASVRAGGSQFTDALEEVYQSRRGGR